MIAPWRRPTPWLTGIVRKEYVAVPASLLAKTSELKPYFTKSYAWVKAMKPKATTRKPTKRKPK
jgi:TfoX/Sxy family transcriptional regulator of competence genes